MNDFEQMGRRGDNEPNNLDWTQKEAFQRGRAERERMLAPTQGGDPRGIVFLLGFLVAIPYILMALAVVLFGLVVATVAALMTFLFCRYLLSRKDVTLGKSFYISFSGYMTAVVLVPLCWIVFWIVSGFLPSPSFGSEVHEGLRQLALYLLPQPKAFQDFLGQVQLIFWPNRISENQVGAAANVIAWLAVGLFPLLGYADIFRKKVSPLSSGAWALLSSLFAVVVILALSAALVWLVATATMAIV